MGEPCFHLKGTGLTAYRALGKSAASQYGTVSIVAGAGTGIIEDSYINLDQGAFGQRGLVYDGNLNLPVTQKCSVLIRCSPGDTTNLLNLFYFGGQASNWGNQSRFNGAGGLSTTCNQTPAGASLINQTGTLSYSAGTWYDLVWVIDGTLTTGALKFYVDGTLITTSAFSATRAALTEFMGSAICIGMQNTVGQNQTRIKLGEFVIWDEIIDPTASGLNLSGSGRTSFVTSTAFDGTSTNPGISNVRLATNYTITGTKYTGTLVVPALSDTKIGVAGDGGTGTYDGSERYTDLDQSQVQDTIAFRYNSLTNNRVGTLLVSSPTAQQIADAVWDAETADYQTSGTFGALMAKLLTVGKFLGLK